MTQSQHIIIVDDEAPAREMVGEYLKMHGFTVTLCDGGKSLRGAIENSVPDLVVLDLNMPEEDGLSIIRDLKSRTNVPVIMLTATASPIDRVVGLELGADDYIAKPCELRELMARIRSVLRRSSPAKAAAPETAAAKAAKDQLVRFGTKWLDLEAQALRDDEGNEHPLTASEFGLLKVFAANPKRVLSRERLLELANARDAEAFDRAVDLRIMRIRRKIEIDPTQARGDPHHPGRRLPVFAGRRKGLGAAPRLSLAPRSLVRRSPPSGEGGWHFALRRWPPPRASFDSHDERLRPASRFSRKRHQDTLERQSFPSSRSRSPRLSTL